MAQCHGVSFKVKSQYRPVDWTEWKAPRGVKLDGGAWGISVIVPNDKGVTDIYQVDDISRFMNGTDLKDFLQAVYGKVS